MKIVASTKLTRAQRAMTESRSYGQTSNTVFEKAETKAEEAEDKKTLIVVASSDKGLCGGIHSGLSKACRRMLEANPNADVVVLGEKSKAQLSRSSAKHIVLSFAGVGKDVPTFADAQAIADQICMLPTDYKDVQILYNKFINAQSYEPTPIEAFSEEAIKNSRKTSSANFLSPIVIAIPQFTNERVPLQPTSPRSKPTTKSSPTCVNTPSPTPSSGPSPRVTRASNPPDGTQWT